MNCSHCHTENRSGAKFCKGCGKALSLIEVHPPVQRAEQTLACNACGIPNKPGAKFCSSCGAGLSNAENLKPPPPPPPSSHHASTSAAAMEPLSLQPIRNVNGSRADKKLPMLLALSIAGLVTAGAGTWFWLHRSAPPVATALAATAGQGAAPREPVQPPPPVTPPVAAPAVPPADETVPRSPPVVLPQTAIPPEPTETVQSKSADVQAGKMIVPPRTQATAPTAVQPARPVPPRQITLGRPEPPSGIRTPDAQPRHIARSPVPVPVQVQVPPRASEPDWYLALKRGLVVCRSDSNFLARVLCEEKVKWSFCGPSNRWGKVPECHKTERPEYER